MREVRLTLEKLINSGIVARVFVEPQPHERNGHYVLGFNAAHPVYEQILDLCSAISGKPRSTKPPLYVDLEEYGVDGLFMTDLRLNVLTSVAIGIHGEIDPATVFRWFTEHDRGLLERRLREWAEEGLLIRRGDVPQTYYRFNRKHPYVPALLALFRRIAEVWPDYGDLPALEPVLYPQMRAARERNRPRPLRGA